jgi:XTP/dITP diphosphohydrolase
VSCKLLLATNNPGKVSEYRTLLSGISFELVTLQQAGIISVIEETGRTFEENARLKAVTLAVQSRLIALADDSGLEVDALGGEPGVMSARYAGENASDADRVNFLLSRLTGVPWDKRTALFKCIIAIATPAGDVALCEGECRGFITFEPKGKNGFGYDPLFFFPELGKTMAELSPKVKGRISHRARAVMKVPEILSHPPFNCPE